jgi:hypothetical protein
MVLRRRGDTTVKCPRCGAPPRDEGVGGWAHWSVMRRWDEVTTDKEFSSSCPGRFRTTVEEDSEEEITSPATSAQADADPNQRSIAERRATTPRQDTSEGVWKRFRLLSIVSLVRQISKPIVKVDEDPKKRCKNCGTLGRHENEKCVEKWEPGPQGPETRCEECSRKPDISPDNDIKDSNVRRGIGKTLKSFLNKGSAPTSSASVENSPSITFSSSSPSASLPRFSSTALNPGSKPLSAPTGSRIVENTSKTGSSTSAASSSFPTIKPNHGFLPCHAQVSNPPYPNSSSSHDYLFPTTSLPSSTANYSLKNEPYPIPYNLGPHGNGSGGGESRQRSS